MDEKGVVQWGVQGGWRSTGNFGTEGEGPGLDMGHEGKCVFVLFLWLVYNLR